MKENEVFKLILMKGRIPQKSISKESGVSEALISRYISGKRNLSIQVFDNICVGLIGMNMKKRDLIVWKRMYLEGKDVNVKKINRIV